MDPFDPARRSFPASLTSLALAVVLLLSAAGCGGDGGGGSSTPTNDLDGISVVEVSMDRPVNPALGAIRLTIVNGSSDADALVGVSSADGNASIHRSDTDAEGRSTMTAVELVEVPARSSVRFEAGGLHVMLAGIARDLDVGDQVSLMLEFASHPPVAVRVPVVEPLSADEADGGAHQHSAPPTSIARLDPGAPT